MTDTKIYQVNGAVVTITARLLQHTIDMSITVDLSALDSEEPEHSDHNLMNYLNLPGYSTGIKYWWVKTSRKVSCKTSSQARRIIKNALTKIDDAIEQAQIKRTTRKAEMQNIFA